MHIYPLRRLPFLLLALGLSALAAEERPLLSLQPVAARPGDPVLVTVRGLAQAPTGTLGERPLRFYPVRDGFQALTGLAVEQVPGQVPVKVSVPATSGAAPTELSGTLDVVAPGWPERRLKVANKFVKKKPAPEVQARMEADRAAFAAAFAQSFVAPLFTENFAWPRQDTITAPYGDLRTFNGKKQSQHFGTDLRGAVGVPVYSANAGTVVMTRDAYASGNTVLVYHGAGLYTAYFHLSATDVKDGQRVERGQLLGKVGATGRVTGPHLHWGVKVDDLWVDGETLLELDFNGGGAPAVTQRDKP
ncbi:M23 family metallopeptidase [Archangium violaceum]|uniref:M23 family metallopeptidase n=1 Tax=Archangium violaceum TaxID=83451 RepID=UPI00193B14E8|nr:M23 family metallopeptidase [Archangium violaceum]QRK07861.1 M23 family metallopeptidase [Archangium violaceum]